MKLLIGTSNSGKVHEIQETLSSLNVELLTPKDLSITGNPEETGMTFSENALQKARFFYDRSLLPTIADDSGIVVEALNNELGIYTRRWGAGAEASDQEWIEHFLNRMKQEENRNAQFVCSLAYIDQNGNEHLYEGICKGQITYALEANYLSGLPISACFKPDGFTAVYSAMSIEEKNAVSHRGKAVQQFAKELSLLLHKT